MARTLIRNATILSVDPNVGDLRATGPDWSLAQYFTGVRVVMGGLYTPEDNYIANLLGTLDALDRHTIRQSARGSSRSCSLWIGRGCLRALARALRVTAISCSG
jgi:hypothetical protein